MTGLYVERIARKRHRCDTCRGEILPGTSYVRAALPPWTDPNESPHWRTLTLHGRNGLGCPE